MAKGNALELAENRKNKRPRRFKSSSLRQSVFDADFRARIIILPFSHPQTFVWTKTAQQIKRGIHNAALISET